MDIGNHLREARLRRGLSLEQIARATRVPAGALRRIETNDFARLPAGIFAKGYLRAYASQVGVDPDAIVMAFSEQVPSAAAPEPLSRLAARVSGPPRATRGTRVTAFVCVTIAAVLLIAGYVRFRGDAAEPIERAVEPAASRPVEGDARPAAAREIEYEGVALEIEPAGPCWVSATADGRLVLHRLLAGGERVTRSARREIVLRIGDPGVFEYRINGRRGRLLGPPGEAITVAITPETADEFVEEAALRRAISST